MNVPTQDSTVLFILLKILAVFVKLHLHMHFWILVKSFYLNISPTIRENWLIKIAKASPMLQHILLLLLASQMTI